MGCGWWFSYDSHYKVVHGSLCYQTLCLLKETSGKYVHTYAMTDLHDSHVL